MIRYRLACDSGHEFDSWFASSDACEALETAGELACPHCASTNVRRAIMAPSVCSRTRATNTADASPAAEPAQPPPETPTASDGIGEAHALPVGDGSGAEQVRGMLREMRRLRDEILSRSEYVGPRFAEEARRMHHDEAPERAIHGEASAREVRELAEDGITALPLPTLPDDLN